MAYNVSNPKSGNHATLFVPVLVWYAQAKEKDIKKVGQMVGYNLSNKKR